MNNEFDGLLIEPDGWKFGELLKADNDTYTDDSWAGCDYRLPSKIYSLGVNIKITGRESHFVPRYRMSESIRYKTRAKIEFVGDGEPSTYLGAWLYSRYPLAEKNKEYAFA